MPRKLSEDLRHRLAPRITANELDELIGSSSSCSGLEAPEKSENQANSFKDWWRAADMSRSAPDGTREATQACSQARARCAVVYLRRCAFQPS